MYFCRNPEARRRQREVGKVIKMMAGHKGRGPSTSSVLKMWIISLESSHRKLWKSVERYFKPTVQETHGGEAVKLALLIDALRQSIIKHVLV